MIATLEHVEILDQAEQLGRLILKSEVVDDYKRVKRALQEDEVAQQLIRNFINIKDDYDDVQRFGRYHPDYNEIMKSVRSTKRKMDMNDKVAAYKIAERQVQKLLDDISECIAGSVSDQIKVPKDGVALSDTGCASGGCGTGGTCSCRAS